MRLLLWILLVTLVAILSSCDAASVNENKALQRKLYNKVASHALAADDGFKHDKRALRGASNGVTEARAATVSTGFSSRLMAFFRSIKDKYLAWEQKILVPGFEKMAKKGTTYTQVREDFRTRLNWSGLWGTPSGFKRYAKLYKTWLEKNHYSHLAVNGILAKLATGKLGEQNMAYSTDIEFQGVTAFEAPPAPSFRYTLALKDDKLSIWMEDCVSKKQWCKGGMKTSDYTSSANAIPDASASDYAKCFQDALECDFDKKSEVQRKITALKDGILRLELVMSIRFIRSSWDAKYVFDLGPVSVERIDILESKLRDYRDELVKLCGPPTFANLEATTKTSNSVVIWNAVEADDFIITDDEGVVTIVQPGVYHVVSMINCAPINCNQWIQLLKNGEVIQQNYCGYTSGNWLSEALDAVVPADEGDKLTITCFCNLTTSYLSVTMLGK